METGHHSLLDLGEPVGSFSISTEIGKVSLLSFPKFLMRDSSGKFGQIIASDFNQIAGEHSKFLMFKAVWHRKDFSAIVRIRLESPLVVDIFSQQGRNPEFERRLEDYLLLSLQLFEEMVRNETIYLSFVPGSEETSKISLGGKLSERFLTGNMLNLILLAFVISIFLVILLGEIAPIILVVVLLTIVLSAGKMMAMRSEWKITRDNPDVVIVELHLDQIIPASFLGQHLSDLPVLKRRLYDAMTEVRRALSPQEISNIALEQGIRIQPEHITVKRIRIYDIVRRAAERFDMPVPTIMVTRNVKPNAAATGFTKHLATMLITFGLFVQLDEKELELVVGHELSHLRFGDPAILFTIFSAEYLLRVYVFYEFIAGFWLLYLMFVFWMVFFVGKLLEARADLEAALLLKDPKTMATSLKKIGFRRLSLDTGFIEGRETHLGDWLAFDPHPPIGFRIRRLEGLDLTDMPKHTLLRSISDVFRGIARAIKG